MCEHQRINSTSFVFSAALPALLATAANETIDNFTRYPEMFTALQENIRAVRTVLGGIDSLEIMSHSISPIVHIAIRQPSPARLSPALEPAHVKAKGSSATSILTRDPPTFDVAKEEALLQDVVDEALLQGVLITRAKRLYGDGDEKQVSILLLGPCTLLTLPSPSAKNGIRFGQPFVWPSVVHFPRRNARRLPPSLRMHGLKSSPRGDNRHGLRIHGRGLLNPREPVHTYPNRHIFQHIWSVASQTHRARYGGLNSV